MATEVKGTTTVEGLKRADVTLAQTDITNMYDTPVQLIPAAPTGHYHVVCSVVMRYTKGSADFGGGGVIGLQYGSAANGGGYRITRSVASTLTSAPATNPCLLLPQLNWATASLNSDASLVGSAVTLSNQSAAFTNAGSGASLRVFLAYQTLSASK